MRPIPVHLFLTVSIPWSPGCSLPACSTGQLVPYGRVPAVLLLLHPHAGPLSASASSQTSAPQQHDSPSCCQNPPTSSVKTFFSSLFRVQTQRSHTHTSAPKRSNKQKIPKIETFTRCRRYLAQRHLVKISGLFWIKCRSCIF